MSFPRDHLVFVGEARSERVVKLPVIVIGVASAGSGDVLWITGVERPAAHVYFVGAVVEGFARAPHAEPVPVVRLYVIGVILARRWALPQIPIQRRRNLRFLAYANGLARVSVPGFCEIGAAD